jgi:hypothetical protein
MSYEELCYTLQQPGLPAHLSPVSPMVFAAQEKARREREIGLVQAQFLVWLAEQYRREG